MVKVYSVKWCPECIKLKKYLDTKGVKYKEVIVADGQEQRLEVLEVSGQRSVPVMTIGNKVVIGFKKAEIDAAVNKQ